MDGGHPIAPLGLDLAALGQLMPMHLWVGGDGSVRAAGPAVAKLAPGRQVVGADFAGLFEFVRPVPAVGQGLGGLAGQRLRLRLRDWPHTRLRGLAVPLAGGAGTLVNLSLGLGAVEAVRHHDLLATDFAPTDPTVDLLFLAEVKAAVTDELIALTRRLKGAHETAEAMAMSDPLTGLANRRAFDEALERAVSAARRGHPFVLAAIDLDRFKAVNDLHGHAAGDHVLCAVAEVLRASTRRHDTIARLGGDEFAMLLRGRIDPPTIRHLTARIIGLLERPIPFEGVECRISGSIGLAMSADHAAPTAAQMMADADAALYAAKRAGRGRALFHAPAGTARP